MGPQTVEFPLTQEELLYQTAPNVPINTILFSDEFEEALSSVERELEQAAASKSDDGELSELGEVLAFLVERQREIPLHQSRSLLSLPCQCLLKKICSYHHKPLRHL